MSIYSWKETGGTCHQCGLPPHLSWLSWLSWGNIFLGCYTYFDATYLATSLSIILAIGNFSRCIDTILADDTIRDLCLLGHIRINCYGLGVGCIRTGILPDFHFPNDSTTSNNDRVIADQEETI